MSDQQPKDDALPKDAEDVLPPAEDGETNNKYVLRVLRELTRLFQNTQLDVDWMRDQLKMLIDGVQGVVDEQRARDAKTDWIVAHTAKTNERLRWVVVITILPSLTLMVLVCLIAFRFALGLIDQTFDMFEQNPNAALFDPAAKGCAPAPATASSFFWWSSPDTELTRRAEN